MSKKLFSILLSFVMMVSFMPAMAVTSFAETDPVDVGTWSVLQSTIDGASGNTALIKLTDDIECGDGESLINIPANSHITIDLNGHTINRELTEATANGFVMVVRGELTLEDSGDATGTIKGGNNSSPNGGGICVDPNGSLIMNGGNITNNISQAGGGVFVNPNASFVMNGGKIENNISVKDQDGHQGGGGGVYLRGSFTFNNGEISGNAARSGGGVYVYAKDDSKTKTSTGGHFIMNGGKIMHNTASDDAGGIYADNYDIDTQLLGGEISNNKAVKFAGGVCCNMPITVGGSVRIQNNTSGNNNAKDNVYLSNVTKKEFKPVINISSKKFLSSDAMIGVTMESGIGQFANNAKAADAKCFSADAIQTADYTVKYDNGTLKLAWNETPVNAWTELQNTINDASKAICIQLAKDISANGESAINIPSGKTITFDLNGHTIDRGLKEATANGSVITVNGGNLTINDSSKDGSGKITGGNSTGQFGMNGGGITVLCGGKLIFNSGNITVNYGYLGGGISVSSGEAILNGGTVSGNRSSNGGGIYTVMGTNLILSDDASVSNNKAVRGGGGIFAKGNFLMSGGEVSKNTAIENGGGVYVYGDDADSTEPKKYSFKMTGGKITSNYSMRKGGGVIADKYNMEMIMTGGEIARNDAELSGGGIYAVESITVGGTAKVVNNLVGANSSDGKFTGGTTNNTFLKSGKKLLISSTNVPSSGMKVGVSMASVDAFADVSSSTIANYFFSDNSSYKVQYNQSTGTLELVENDQPKPTVVPITDSKVSIAKINNPTISKDGVKPELKIECDGKLLVENVDYTVKYIGKLNRVGTVSVVIKGIGNYSGETRTTFKVLPKNTKISSLKKGKKSFTIKVAKQSKSKVNGYKVRYSVKKSMSGSTTRTIGKKYNKTSLTVKKLKSKKTYYVQVRTYKKAKDGKNYYSNWSAVKKVKTK